MNPVDPNQASQNSIELSESLRMAWERGESRLIEERLGPERLQELSTPQLLELLYEEFLARRRAGGAPAADDYVARFPQHHDAIRRLFELHAEIGESLARKFPPESNSPGAETPTVDLADADLTCDQLVQAFRDWRAPRRESPADAEPTCDLKPENTSSLKRPAALEEKKLACFGNYELLAEIARGGMGVVFKARQVKLRRIVALKMIASGHLAAEADIKRFQAEAEAAAQLDHPAIVPVFEVGEHEGLHYFSMGLVDGPSLATRLAEGPLPPREAAALLKTVAEGVQYAHDRGIVHRDLKPGNILLERSSGQPRITDFGLAKQTQGASDLTGTGQILGTPSYMPPEQAVGQSHLVREPADIYALGAVLYATLTGRPPFQADNPLDTLRMVMEREPVPPRQLNPAIPIDLETICLKCLDKIPARRYPSAQALAEELERFLSGQPILARPVGPLHRAWRWAKRNRAVASLLALVFLSLSLGAAISTYFAIEARVQSGKNFVLAKQEGDARRESDQRKRIAEREFRRATAQRLAVQASELRYTNPVRSLLLAKSAVEISKEHLGEVAPLVQQSLHRSLAGFGGKQVFRHQGSGIINALAISDDHRWLVSAVDYRRLLVHDLSKEGTDATQVALEFNTKGLGDLHFLPDSETVIWRRTSGGLFQARVSELKRGEFTTLREIAPDPRYEELSSFYLGRDWLVLSRVGRMRLVGPEVPRDPYEETKHLFARLELWHINKDQPLELRASIDLGNSMGAIATLSPDEKQLYVGEHDWIRRYDLSEVLGSSNERPHFVWELHHHNHQLFNLTVSQDGQWLAANVRPDLLLVWPLDTASAPPPIALKAPDSRGHAFSLDSRFIATLGPIGSRVRIWDLRRLRESDVPKSIEAPGSVIVRGLDGVTYIHDGQMMVVSANGALFFFDQLKKGFVWRTALQSSGNQLLVRQTRDGEWLATAEFVSGSLPEATIRVIPTASHAMKANPVIIGPSKFDAEFQQPQATGALTAVENILVTNHYPNWYDVAVWDLAKPEEPPQVLGKAEQISLSNDRRWLVTGHESTGLTVYNLLLPRPLAPVHQFQIGVRMQRGKFVTFVSRFLKDPDRWLIAGRNVWDLRAPDVAASHRLLPEVEQKPGLTKSLFSDDNRWLIRWGRDPGFLATNMETLQTTLIVPEGLETIEARDLYFQQGKLMITDGRRDVFIWAGGEQLPGKLLTRVQVTDQLSFKSKLSRDGKTLATWGQGLLKVWTWENDRLTLSHSLFAHNNDQVDYCSVSKRLAIAKFTDEVQVQLWELAGNTPVSLTLAEEVVLGTPSFSPDGRWLLVQSKHNLQMFRTNLDELVGLAREQAGRDFTPEELQIYTPHAELPER